MHSDFAQKAHVLKTGLPSREVVAAARLILALLAFFVIAAEGFGSKELVNATKVLLVLYVLYALILWLQLLRNWVIQSIQRWAAWIDIAFFTLLFLSCNTNHKSIFFFAFSFAILSESLNSGYAAGLRIGIASLAALGTIGFMVEFRERAVLASSQPMWVLLCLVGIVCVASYFAGSAREVARQFLLLQEITSLSNPHFGAGRTVASVMERLRAFYAADCCIVIMQEGESPGYQLRRVDSHQWERALCPEAVPPELQLKLVGLLSPKGVIYSRRSQRWLTLSDNYLEIEVVKGAKGEPAEGGASDRVATMFETESFLAVPLCQGNRVAGRLYLTSQKPHAFVPSDATLVYQLIVHTLALVENIRLSDRLALEAAERERKKIAFDIHDNIIQPYIGIQFGLTGLRQKLQQGDLDVEEDINVLMDMTDGEIFGLRRYMAELTEATAPQLTLLASVHSFAHKFSNASGIAVEIKNSTELTINQTLAVEAFHMVVEGLSNIRRHTQAKRAIVKVECDREYFALQIEDEGSVDRKASSFFPRSIAARAAALGGIVRIRPAHSGGTQIIITIPL